jgi:molybdate/tungstate transport system ATP-binding protein
MIRTEGISFRVGQFELKGIDLHIARGEYFVLMGPPGSGKTILLECLCGLRRIGAGRVLIDGRDVTDLEPRERGIGYVPQNYGLFSHLSVAGNIGFGLRRRHTARRSLRHKIRGVAELLGIDKLLDRSVGGLSGGEKQRVALARAIVVEPKVLFLDEPVSALDEATRRSVCSDLKSLHDRLGMSTIHICHNREEALSVADRAAVLRDGGLQQIGSPHELLRKPQNEFVAAFMCCENVFEGQVIRRVETTESTRISVSGVEFAASGRFEGKVKLVIRPEHLGLARTMQSGEEEHVQVPCTLVRTADCGPYIRAELDGVIRLVSYLSHAHFNDLGVHTGDSLVCTIRSSAVHVLSA